MSCQMCYDDLPSGVLESLCDAKHPIVAIDTETMGLITRRDRLCLVQLALGDGHTYLIHIQKKPRPAKNLMALLADQKVLKLFHFARFDMASLYHAFGVMPAPVYCTKIASKLVRTYTDRHGLRELCREILGKDLTKTEQTSDWGHETLTEEQKRYAAKDVLYLHALKHKLDSMLLREERTEFAGACFDFLPTRVRLDLMGWEDILAH